jgi:hypothetical protein
LKDGRLKQPRKVHLLNRTSIATGKQIRKSYRSHGLGKPPGVTSARRRDTVPAASTNYSRSKTSL